jgi:hypothetical protein
MTAFASFSLIFAGVGAVAGYGLAANNVSIWGLVFLIFGGSLAAQVGYIAFIICAAFGGWR